MAGVVQLAPQRYLALATFRRSGAQVSTPVWFSVAEDRLYVVAAGDSGKVKRLRNSPRARVAPCDARGYTQGPWQNATARLVTDAATIDQAHAALRAKYRWQAVMLDLVARLSGRIHRRAWIEIELAAP